MKIGIHRVHNKFPEILHYWKPRWLNSISWECGQPRIYKWFWFSIAIGDKDPNHKWVGYHEIGGIISRCPKCNVRKDLYDQRTKTS